MALGPVASFARFHGGLTTLQTYEIGNICPAWQPPPPGLGWHRGPPREIPLPHSTAGPDGKPGQMVHINLCHLMRNAVLWRTAEFNLIFSKSSFVLVVVVIVFFFFSSSPHFALILFALVIFVDYSGLI